MRARDRVLLAILLASSMLPFSASIAVEQEAHRGRFPQNLHRYLKDRHPQIDDDVISSLQETPHGPLGHLNISGRIVPEAAVGYGGPEERARGTALAFIQEESVILGVSDPAELKEMEIEIEESGAASVRYVRTVGGLELLDSSIFIRLDADGAITRVDATVKPVCPELRQAVKKAAISRQDVRRIVERDLAQRGRGAPVMFLYEPREVATWQAPYAVWAAMAFVDGKPAWSYLIDAFTGEIRSRSCSAFTMTDDGGTTPCD